MRRACIGGRSGALGRPRTGIGEGTRWSRRRRARCRRRVLRTFRQQVTGAEPPRSSLAPGLICRGLGAVGDPGGEQPSPPKALRPPPLSRGGRSYPERIRAVSGSVDGAHRCFWHIPLGALSFSEGVGAGCTRHRPCSPRMTPASLLACPSPHDRDSDIPMEESGQRLAGGIPPTRKMRNVNEMCRDGRFHPENRVSRAFRVVPHGLCDRMRTRGRNSCCAPRNPRTRVLHAPRTC